MAAVLIVIFSTLLYSEDNHFYFIQITDTQLEKNKNSKVIIFHHAPSVSDFYKNEMHDGWPDDVQGKWIELINSFNVIAVIAGHFHRDEHHWLGNVPLYVAAPIAEFFGRQITYRIYEYKNGRVGYRTVYVE